MVVDASAMLPTVLEDESDSQSDQLLDRVVTRGAHAPSIWAHEVANAVLVAARRRRIAEHDVGRVFENLHALDVVLHEATLERVAGPIRHVAQSHGLTIYDASYLDLAVRLQLPLATRDVALQAAARVTGVELILA
ncbi:MAG: type II toxin-antitoxin system VapC family toxin [Rhodospirillaceae bacterium]|nr:type II toxin-antitoxin system VapC family toxin [Rhodospirillaceae bacterium]